MRVDLRKPFIEELTEIARHDKDIVFITCDVGFSFLEPLKEVLGARFLNLGVTEQSAMVTAAGLALAGKKVFVYSMINFMVFRPYEMVRNAVCCHNANVKILGVSGSEAYAFLGFSHNMLHKDEDLNLLHQLPNIEIYLPATEEVARVIAYSAVNNHGPMYIRL